MMGLFICAKCNCVENTALGWYWSSHKSKEMIVLPKELEQYHGKPLCSECLPVVPFIDGSGKTGIGKWHGKFPKEDYEDFRKTEEGKHYQRQGYYLRYFDK